MLQDYKSKQTFYDIAVYKQIEAICKKLGSKVPVFIDGKKPKPVSAYQLYVSEISKNGESMLQNKDLNQWKTMTDADKATFAAKHSATLKRYEAERNHYEVMLKSAISEVKQDIKKHLDSTKTPKKVVKKKAVGKKAKSAGEKSSKSKE